MMALRDVVGGVFEGKPPSSYDADIDENIAANLCIGYNHLALACKETGKRTKQLNAL